MLHVQAAVDAGLSFKKGLAKLNASTDEDMLRCFTLTPCNVNVAIKQLKKDRYMFYSGIIIC